MRHLRLALLLVAGLAATARAQHAIADSAQRLARPRTAAVVADPNDPLTVYLMTMGPGAEVWERFGHNAIWIHDERTHTDRVYNWGIFDFNQPRFVPRFLAGHMLYSMAPFELNETLDVYRERDRTITVQELSLTPQQEAQLQFFVEWNALPQNADYAYNYFLDNCSTRVRDALDRVLGGAMQRTYGAVATASSFRDAAVRVTQPAMLLSVGIDIGLGRPADHRMTRWEAMYLPSEVHDAVARLLVRDSAGGRRPLVKSERVLYQSRDFREPISQPHWTPSFLALGLVIAVVLVLLGEARLRGVAGTGIALAVLAAVIAWVFGLLGLVLTLVRVATDHRFMWGNENLLVLQPAWLVAGAIAPWALRRAPRSWAVQWARIIAWIGAALAIVAVLIHVVGLSRQDNVAILALTVPPALALGWIFHGRRLGLPRRRPAVERAENTKLAA